MPTLQGKTILITGASMGLGLSVATAMALRGARLILCARSEERLQNVRQELANPSVHHPIRCDVTSQADVESLCRRIEEIGSLDGIVHNAGAILYETFLSSSEPDERALFELNFFSILRLTRRLLPMLERGADPSLVLMSSAAAWRALPLWSAYCASKAALTSWAEAVRLELKPKGIRVIAIYPGVTRTGLSDHAKSRGPKPFSTTEGKGMSPESVAARVVRAYESGKRDEFVGIFNRVYRLATFLAPRLMDAYFERTYKKRGWLP